MARDLYKSRKMYESPLFFILIIPIGFFILLLIGDTGIRMFNEAKLNHDTKEILTNVMQQSNLNDQDYQDYIEGMYKSKGYETDSIKIINNQDSIILYQTKYYYTVFGAFRGNKKSFAYAQYEGKFVNGNLTVKKFDNNGEMVNFNDFTTTTTTQLITE